MFSESSIYYDKIYGFKDYSLEAKKIISEILRYCPKAKTLIDIACGTAEHMRYIGQEFEWEGLDLDANMLEVARQKFPNARLHHGSMIDFKLGRRFDVILCLFSSIGYVQTEPNLELTIRTFAEHLAPGGVLMVEPWLTRAVLRPGKPHMQLVDEPGLKICRMSMIEVEADGLLSHLDMEYMIAESGMGIRRAKERHTLGMFESSHFEMAFENAGLTMTHEPVGLDGRGLYIGRWA